MMFAAKSWGLLPMSTGSRSAGGLEVRAVEPPEQLRLGAVVARGDDDRQIGGLFRGRRVETELGGRARRLLDAMRLLGRRNHLDEP